jgi:fermentation-respiration switch protein FrsA (DUF1100 family)
MSRTLKALIALAVVVLLAFTGMAWFARGEAARLVTSPLDSRRPIDETPADVGMAYRDVTVTSADGVNLAGWWTPSENGAALILQHGYKVNRSTDLLGIAALFAEHGYGVLLSSVRAHDVNGGELITFGREEMQDLAAWIDFARLADGVDPERIGIFGNSLGGSLVIQVAAQSPEIKAVVAHSAFASMRSTVETSIRYFTGLPPFPFAPMIVFWVGRDRGMYLDDFDFTQWVDDLSPRPILFLQGGADVVVTPESGRLLYDAAREPKELWFDPDLEHIAFFDERPDEFERRVVGFYDRYLPAPVPASAAEETDGAPATDPLGAR